MIKGKLIEFIRREALQNGVGVNDDMRRVTLRQVEIAIDNLYGDVLFLLLKKSSDLDFFAKSYDNVAIQKNATSKQYYSDLPVNIVQLPDNLAVRLIKGNGTNRKFYPTDNESVDIYSDTDISTHYDKPLYIIDGLSRVRYINFDYASLNIRSVSMKLIPTFMSYTWDEEVPLPSGRITEFTNIVAKQLFQSKKFLDTSSDGVSA
jgi:hypothetical protein